MRILILILVFLTGVKLAKRPEPRKDSKVNDVAIAEINLYIQILGGLIGLFTVVFGYYVNNFL